ncbi:hypothetical protein PMAYCL1PPCAC_03474, partial [Pristionchus mayeri]
MPTPLLLSCAHYAICSFGMFANAALFIIIVTRTPRKMRSYGAVLATSAAVDFLTAASSCATFAKNEMYAIYAFTGPCTGVSFRLCIYLLGVTLCGHAFFAYNITLCFCYR